jgi:hypothetical protein
MAACVKLCVMRLEGFCGQVRTTVAAFRFRTEILYHGQWKNVRHGSVSWDHQHVVVGVVRRQKSHRI